MESSAVEQPELEQTITTNGNGAAKAGRCPLLGISENPGKAFSTPSTLNFCHQSGLPIPVGSLHQEHYCLTSLHETCPIFVQAQREAEARRVMSIAAVPAPIHTGSDREEIDSIFVPVDPETPRTMPDLPVADLFDWAEKERPDFPLFDPNVHVKIVPRRHHRNGRKYLIYAFILAGLLIIGWWAWLTFLSENGGTEPITNRLNRVPTLVPTAYLGSLETTDALLGDTTNPTVSPLTTEPAPSLAGESNQVGETDAEAIALTAGALFAGTTPASCSPPSWWVRYIVQSNDSIEALALSRGITKEEIIQANCLPTESLASVALIYLPPLGFIPTSTATALPAPGENINNTPRPPQPTAPLIQFPTLPPVVAPPVVTSAPIIIISTEVPPIVAPTSPPPPPPPTDPPPQPTNPPQPTPPLPATPTSGPPPTSTPPPLP